MTGHEGRLPSSFRDPAGYVYLEDGRLRRQVRASHRHEFDRLMDSGLYAALTDRDLFVRHTTVTGSTEPLPAGDITIEPERIPFVSYPQEWCFSQLRAAALCTLEVQKLALQYGMSLKDASAFNVLFRDTRPVFIDTLSLVTYREGEPWVAYRQFCEHFLAPLLVMSYVDARLQAMARAFIDGLPLQMASRMLPWRSRLSASALMHVHFHSWSQARAASGRPSSSTARVSRLGLQALVDSLESVVRRLTPRVRGSVWLGYYDDNSYSAHSLTHKAQIVDEYLGRLAPRQVWDLGANDGRFSRLAAARGALTIASDADAATVEKNYRDCVTGAIRGVLPLVMDLANPTPAQGWACRERQSLVERGPVDVLMALALMHHLVVSNHVSVEAMADLFSALGRAAIVEYVPPDDPQVTRLLAHRGGGSAGYTLDEFDAAFGRRYRILDRRPVGDTGRIMYLMSGE